MTTPKPEEFEHAADWLRAYEGDDDLTAAFEAVAVYLERKAKEKRLHEAVRKMVERTGATPTQARRKLRELGY